ncbi:GlsB/YeaQ/YmgE family stress response membrane protein [Rhizobium sp. P38BS-XIX]|uniref:GlsB/YeaQ/YmgE family stress response membrane protein n=1 Tax=Rhizobium sp. P38BS-XIX TaxID=2726740 RepID=UPI00145635BB|nr:GlsB/YeaQ/YmgE family stress response membrane protein [Rhizobium sp. P38BS-XIX]NLR96017.1 GlsB/YeaQ/YmgE family stress response membrane protein [Rhizobium sp. P38BS-XIX]
MEVGWIAAIIIGGLAGWFAEMVMKSNTGIFMNIVLGIVGALVASWLFRQVGFTLPFNSALINYLITGFIGACILIFVGRLIRR